MGDLKYVVRLSSALSLGLIRFGAYASSSWMGDLNTGTFLFPGGLKNSPVLLRNTELV